MLNLLNSLGLLPVRPRWAEFTDAGPGVGVNNTEVSFRDADLSRIYQSDYQIRVHRAAGDTGQNESERTNSAIGDSVVDGAMINWEHHKRFEGLTEHEIASVSLTEYEKIEERMEKNAWRVAEEVASRIDDAPVHSEYIKCFVANKCDDGLFFNKEYLKEYFSRSGDGRMTVPGVTYMEKIVTFQDTHYKTGELYMEYRDKQPCSHCASCQWVGPAMHRIPRPWPNEVQKPNFHYKDVFESPVIAGDVVRPPDDWQPRHNIKQKFENWTLTLNDDEAISLFSNTFVVEKELIEVYLQHLTNLERMKSIRTNDRQKKQQQRHQKGFHEYDWDILCRTGGLQHLLLHEIEKYLNHFNLSVQGKKSDKVR